MKKTKIVATYGPAVATPAKIRRLVSNGVNAIRINCSHGTTSQFVKAARLVRKATRSAKYPVGLLFDISGPKLRLDRFDGEIAVLPGQTITLTARKTELQQGIIAVNHPAIIKSVRKGERLFVDDGALIFDIVSADGRTVMIRATNPGVLLPGKGINLPDTDIKIPTITQKDKADIRTAAEVDADFVALSFIRSGDDIIEARRLLKACGGRQKIIAKLEKREAIDCLEEIIMLADGVMIARGDLGVELPPAELPKLQKRIIRLANQQHKPVIVATQMLESMRFSPRATRAEINDVASAVFDFADAVMLSAETATGKYPVETVRTMNEVIVATEEACPRQSVEIDKHMMKSAIPFAIAGAVSESNRYCDTEIIFAFTTSGFTAGLISNLYPPQPVIALTPDMHVIRQLSIYRSVYSIHIKQPKSFADMLRIVNDACKGFKLARKGQNVIITGGAPFGSTVPTNFMMYHEVQ